jgi:S-disulfanyl-L-cysteine oxidoreductase SoxD
MTKTTIPVWIAAGLFAAALTSAAVGAQATKSVNDGVFTAEQATKGEAVYKEQCAACHGDNLEGSGPMPPLAGKDFLSNWQGKTVGDLFEKTQTSMPATAPGTLTPEQTAHVVAYMLGQSKYPAGAMALADKMDDLKISIDAPK